MPYILKKVESRNPFMSIQGQWGANESFNDFMGKKFLLGCGWYYQDRMAWWVGDEKSYLRSRAWFIRKLKEDNDFGRRFFKKNYSNLKKFVDNFPAMIQIARDCPTERAAAQARRFISRATALIAPAFFTDWYAYNAQDWIYGYIDRNKLGESDFRLLTAGKRLSFVKEYERRLAEMKISGRQEGLSDLIRRTPWIKDNYYYFATVTAAVAKNDLRRMTVDQALSIAAADQQLAEKNRRQKKILKSLDLNDFQESLLDLLSDFVDLQDIRKAVVYVTNNVAWIYFNKILDAKKIKGADRKLVLEHASADWIMTLDKEALIARSRQASSGMLKLGYQAEMLGREASDSFKKIAGTFSAVDRIIGYAAQLGKARGRVKIVNRVSDFQDFKAKDILVASMTRPEYVPVLNKCAAIVTDEGGLTCHAAIIAREMKKPCIIGTKIATKILKDGDIVEVDAEKGIVRVIKLSKK